MEMMASGVMVAAFEEGYEVGGKAAVGAEVVDEVQFEFYIITLPYFFFFFKCHSWSSCFLSQCGK